MTGLLQVRAAYTPDGDQQVMTALPNGVRFFLSREDALAYAFAVLAVARDQFPVKAELDAAVVVAFDRSHELIGSTSVQ
jgi:hypothetical protein